MWLLSLTGGNKDARVSLCGSSREEMTRGTTGVQTFKTAAAKPMETRVSIAPNSCLNRETFHQDSEKLRDSCLMHLFVLPGALCSSKNERIHGASERLSGSFNVSDE